MKRPIVLTPLDDEALRSSWVFTKHATQGSCGGPDPAKTRPQVLLV